MKRGCVRLMEDGVGRCHIVKVEKERYMLLDVLFQLGREHSFVIGISVGVTIAVVVLFVFFLLLLLLLFWIFLKLRKSSKKPLPESLGE